MVRDNGLDLFLALVGPFQNGGEELLPGPPVHPEGFNFGSQLRIFWSRYLTRPPLRPTWDGDRWTERKINCCVIREMTRYNITIGHKRNPHGGTPNKVDAGSTGVIGAFPRETCGKRV